MALNLFGKKTGASSNEDSTQVNNASSHGEHQHSESNSDSDNSGKDSPKSKIETNQLADH